MALKFGDAKGKAKKGLIEQYEYAMGDNRLRLVGDLLARYVYWIDGFNGKKIPFECLSFDREAEAFINKEKDWIREYFPDLKCSWSYAINCIDPRDGKVKVLNLKKKLLEQIMVTAEDLGDPTDVEEGWWVHFKKVKTGPMAYNVEYQLQPLKCEKIPLADKEKEKVEEAPSIEEVLVRPTPEAQKKLLDDIQNEGKEKEPMDDDVKDEFDVE